MGELRRRIAVGLALLGFLIAGVLVFGAAFSFVVALGLVAAPAINWLAFLRLRALRRLREARGESVVRSLRSAYFAAFVLAVASTALALIGAFVVARSIPALNIAAISREVFLVGLAWPLLLLTGPAIEWILLVPAVGEDSRLWDRLDDVAPEHRAGVGSEAISEKGEA